MTRACGDAHGRDGLTRPAAGTRRVALAHRHRLLGSAKERLVLAALAVDAGKPVTVDTLIHRVWDDAPPAKPRNSLHTYVARTRHRLRRVGAPESVGIRQQAHTYVLDIDRDAIDSHRFQRLASQARSLADSGDTAGALALFREAEALWHGEPLAGLAGLWAQTVREDLMERRLAAAMARIGMELRQGRFLDLVGDLSALAEEHPTDEGVIGHLMIACYGCERQADALRAFEATRRRLATELGAAPGEALARIHRRILDGVPVGSCSGTGPRVRSRRTTCRHTPNSSAGKKRCAASRARRPAGGRRVAGHLRHGRRRQVPRRAPRRAPPRPPVPGRTDLHQPAGALPGQRPLSPRRPSPRCCAPSACPPPRYRARSTS
ncbi:AfsR/SARP family transcriptional regulator [Streptomyces sp. M19]